MSQRELRRFGLLALALLAACAPSPRQGAYRAQGTPMYSNAVLQTERLAGRWQQVADFAPQGSGCSAPGLVVGPPAGSDMSVQADLCLGGQKRSFDGDARVSGPGRITLTGADPGGIGAEWWILWVDDGYRTMVVGTPSGSFGMILDRQGQVPPDRMQAAREILEWNGYDLSQLRAVRP